jgi:hypothetical protein
MLPWVIERARGACTLACRVPALLSLSRSLSLARARSLSLSLSLSFSLSLSHTHTLSPSLSVPLSHSTESSGRHIRCHEYRRLATLELLQHPVSLPLRIILRFTYTRGFAAHASGKTTTRAAECGKI